MNKEKIQRFHIRVQYSRLIVYTIAFFVGIASRALGVLEFSYIHGVIFFISSELSIFLFILLYRAGKLSILGIPLHALYMATDVLLITWAVHLSGGSSSWWHVWYLTNAAESAFVGGIYSLCIIIFANILSYIASILIIEDFSYKVLMVCAGRMVILYGASIFALLAIIRLRKKKEEISILQKRESRKAEELKKLNQKLRETNKRLNEAMDNIERLEELLPICVYCKKVRTDENYWQQVEAYVSAHSKLKFSHGICPECYEKIVKPKLEGA